MAARACNMPCGVSTGDEADPAAQWERFFGIVSTHIAESGYHLTYVREDPPYCYSVGLAQTWDHPELLLYGLSYEDSATVLAALADAVRRGARLAHGVVDSETLNRTVTFLEIPKDEYYGRLVVTIEVYGHVDFSALQVVTPDGKGRFPWQRGCERRVVEAQPLLGQPRL